MIPVVGFYTVNTPYAQEAQKMVESARSVGLCSIRVFGVPPRANWYANCQIKLEVLLQCCQEMDQPFLYVDVDARFEAYPAMFDLDWSSYDIGAHYFKDKELLSGTLWINPTEATKQLLQECIKRFKEAPKAWDQKMLQLVISEQSNLRVWKLPPEYTFIYDLSRRYYGLHIKPVITHYQASRKYKLSVNR